MEYCAWYSFFFMQCDSLASIHRAVVDHENHLLVSLDDDYVQRCPLVRCAHPCTIVYCSMRARSVLPVVLGVYPNMHVLWWYARVFVF